MPALIKEYYQQWLNSPTLFAHPLDKERFYKFVKSYIRFSKKKLGGCWLRYFLERDLPLRYKDKNFIDENIRHAVYLFDDLVDFDKVPFTQYTEKWYLKKRAK